MKKTIQAKTIEDKDVIIAFDVSGSKTNIDNIKSMLSIFANIVRDYNYKGHILLCDEKIVFDFNIDEIEALDNYVLSINSNTCDYRSVFEYAKQKVENDNCDIFKIYFITDGFGIFPRESEFDTIWVTGKDIGIFPFGEVFEIKV